MSSRRGIPFVVSAPSGTGKTTICRAVVERDPQIEFSISHTTRAPRPGEQDGIHYHFVTAEQFSELVAGQAFVEHAEYAGNLYGTSWKAIDAPLASGRDLLLEVDVQGAEQLRARRRDARFVFLLPPSLDELERRLRERGTDGPEAVARRLAIVRRELEAVHGFDYAVVNERIDEAIEAVCEIVRAERDAETRAVRERYGRQGVVRAMAGRLGLEA